MTILWAWVLLSIGAIIGYFTCALMVIAKEADAHIEILNADRDQDEQWS